MLQLGAAVVTILLNGTVLHSYSPAVLDRGRVRAPVAPFVTAIAGAAQYEGKSLTVRRGDLFAQVRVHDGYVELAPLLRTLGIRYAFDAKTLRLFVYESREGPFVTPTPFNAAVPQQAPRAVFTPIPVHTDTPRVTGVPRPRRTPLPVSVTPSPQP